MLLNRKLHWIVFGWLLIIVAGCDNGDCFQDKSRGIRLTRLEKDGHIISEYQYDENGKLARRIQFDDAKEVQSELEFTYNELGNVLKQDYWYKNAEQGVRRYYYEGDLLTRIVKVPQLDSSDVLRYETEIDYNSNDEIMSVKITKRVNWIEDFSELHEYVLENGNVTNVKSFRRDSSFRVSYDYYAESTFSYDKCKNPYKEKFGVYPILPQYISCNNLTERIDDGEVVISSSYKYRNKFPVQRTTTTNLFLQKETDVVYDYLYE